MYTQSKIIVLSTIKYADADLIVKCLSEKKGKLSFLVKGARKGGKNKTRMAYFQPFNILQATFQYRENKNLLYFKELNIDQPLANIHQDIKRSSIVLLLTEIVEKAIQEEEVNEDMFAYIENAICWLDSNSENQNFHIAFLIGLTRYLGIYPDSSQINDIVVGDGHANLKVRNNSLVKLEELLKSHISLTNAHQFKLAKNEKLEILNALILYYRNMIPGFKIPQSYAVVKDVFS